MTSSQSNIQKVSQPTQTDFSFLHFQEKLHQKESEILHLTSKLKFYKQKLESLQQTIQQSLKASPSLSQLSDDSSKFRTSTPNVRSSLDDYKKGSKLMRNVPLDTFTIQEFPKLAPTSNTVKLKPDSPAEERSSFMKMIKKKSSRLKRALEANPKKIKSKSSKKLNSSLISDMLYQDSQNQQSWKDLMGQFRKDPGLMKFVLDKNDRYYCYFDLGHNKRLNTATRGKRIIASQDLKNRPVKSSASVKPGQGRSLNIDWSQSEIDSLVIKGLFHFQADPNCYSSSQVEELICSKDYEDLDQVYDKSLETLGRLKKELNLPNNYMQGIPKTYESVDNLLATCLNLFKVRAIVVKILKTVHIREDLMLKLMSDDGLTAKSTYLSIHKMNQELVQLIAYLQHARFPVSRFVYLGEDLQEKIQKDNDKLKTLYPILQEAEDLEEEI